MLNLAALRVSSGPQEHLRVLFTILQSTISFLRLQDYSL